MSVQGQKRKWPQLTGMSVPPPKNGHGATTAACPFRAITGSDRSHSITPVDSYSMTSSARNNKDEGIVSPRR
jgi:hypothetical protein